MKVTDFSIVAVWLWSDAVIAEGPEKLAERLYESKITDVYFLVKGKNGRVAFAKGNVPLDRSYGERDIFGDFLEAAHKKGIKVHAWCTFFVDRTYLNHYPEASIGHFKTRFSDKEKDCGDWISPTDPDYLTYSKDLFSELVSNYPVDGIHFDNIRYGNILYGWTPRDRKALETELGQEGLQDIRELLEKTYYIDDGDRTSIFQKFEEGNLNVKRLVKYREDAICRFIEGIKSATSKARAAEGDNPLIFSAAFMPEAASPASFTEDQKAGKVFGLVHYGQNYERAAKLLDYICPMAYHAAFSKQPKWSADIAKGAIEAGAKVVIGIQSYGDEGEIQPEDMDEAISEIKKIDSPALLGIAHFRDGTYLTSVVDLNKDTKELHIHLISPGISPITKIELSFSSPFSDLKCKKLPSPSVTLSQEHTVATIESNNLLSAGNDAVFSVSGATCYPEQLRAFSREQEQRVFKIETLS